MKKINRGLQSIARRAHALVFALTLGVLFCAPAAISCGASGQQTVQNVLTGVTTVTVDLCDVAQNLIPPVDTGTNLIGLICKIAGAAEQSAQIFIDQDVWADMQTTYLATHGALPTGMARLARKNSLQPSGTGLPAPATQDAGPPKKTSSIEVHFHALPME